MPEGPNPSNPIPPAVPPPHAEPSFSLGDERPRRGPARPLVRPEELSDGHDNLSGATGSPASIEELEERVRRLEDKYKALTDTRVIEERVVQRLTGRLRRKPVTDIRDTAPPPAKEPTLPPMPPRPQLDGPAATTEEQLMQPPEPPPVPTPVPAEPALAAQASETPPPLMPPSVEAPVAAFAEPAVATASVAAPVQAPVATIVPEPPPATAYASKIRWIWRWWLILDVLNEFRVIFRMIVDPRYRLTWPARIVPIVVLVLMWFSDWDKVAFLFPWNLVPILGYYCNKLFQIFLTFVMLKVLLREVERYRDMVPDAPRALKLE